jgi:hypothetical protein
MDFKGADRGGYCLQNVTAGCAQPFTIDILDRETLSGMGAQTYCGIREEFTTCEAVLAFGEKCPSDTCPEGGICRKVGSLADKRCTYECDHDLQCNDPPNPGSNCGPGVDPDPVTPDYCGGQ